MTGRGDHLRRGRCPGALRPMESGDGLIVRVRPRAGGLDAETLIALADAASRYGNGHIDLTRRANLQLRGVTRETLPRLLDLLAERGLLDANAEAEAVRNILVSPLAGADPSEVLDVRPLAIELSRLIEADRALWSLPGKFAFLIDGGGALPLDAARADIRLRAIRAGQEARIALGIDRPGEVLWLGHTSRGSAPAATVRVAHAVLDSRPGSGCIRLRDLSERGAEHIGAALSGFLDPLDAPPLPRARNATVGLLNDGPHVFAAGIAMPFGRVEATTLRRLVEVLAAAGAEEARVSPWQTLYVPIRRRILAEGMLGAAASLGLIIDGNDPLLKLDACPGAPACSRAAAATRRDAQLLAAAIRAHPEIRSVHVSGCPKGCARSSPADLVLVARDGGYGLVRNGTASGRPERTIASAELRDLPSVLGKKRGTPCHA
jgi:precorrin-3B synthase